MFLFVTYINSILGKARLFSLFSIYGFIPYIPTGYSIEISFVNLCISRAKYKLLKIQLSASI